MPPYIGRRTRRLEDERLITGRGQFAGDIKLEGLAQVAFCRSSLPHARIRAVDRSAALAMPGVIAVWTADDLPEVVAGLSEPGPSGIEQRGRPILNRDEVNYAGEAYAMVVAETAYQAQDAVEQVLPEFDPLPAVGGVMTAVAGGAAPVHGDMKSNIAQSASIAYGDINAAFAADSVTAKIRLTTARVAGAAMEPRAVTAMPDPETGGIKMWTSTQSIFGVRAAVASALGIDESKVRVLAEDVGGGFGAKASVFPEEVLTAIAAWRLRRPARWVASRSEDSATTAQGHGSVIELELAADSSGKLRGLRGRLIHDIGAYAGSGTGQPSIIVAHMISAYVLPAMDIEHQLVYTNAVPSGFIRGGGRPLGNYAIERVMDRLARELKLEPAELRRRNLIQPDQIPYTTGYPAGRRGYVYDSGDYPRLLEAVLEKLGPDPARDGHADGRLVGLGLACCVESTGFGRGEPAKLQVARDGTVHIYVGSTPQGQGHETMVALVTAERLGWPFEKIRVTAGDTRHVPSAISTIGSRSAVHLGNAAAQAATAMRKVLLERAADVLEADVQDLVLEEGTIVVRGTPVRSVPATDVVPPEGLEVSESFDPTRSLAFSSGCHAAVVAVDPQTGQIEVLRYVIAHDTGKTINPVTLEGQLHGGYAHGLGYAMYEAAIYDTDGTYRTASFLDYTIVSIGEVGSEPELVRLETPTDANPEGFKGGGESGTIPVPAAIANAVEDALRKRNPNAVVDRLPITPDRIVELLRASPGD
ncbi:MAG TPA: xanthine dehydrogenase family protein molybdopterin-binding subunit [Candidatus Dormibacteraeota bacterium]|nr:xanthine dehydrogenase family protein molybdopterin-binding subunit [Candidatus Dormibacteraeota bacterium]